MGIQWDQLAVTSMKLYDQGSNKVRFMEADKEQKGDEKASFVKNVIEIGENDDGERIFEAELVPVNEAVISIARTNMKPMFFVHGFNTEPGWLLDYANHRLKVSNNIREYAGSYFIPVLWPAGSDSLFSNWTSYLHEKENGTLGTDYSFWKAFSNAAKNNQIPSKNIGTFSMGNFALRNSNGNELEFDNIFMFAADCRHDLFHTKYINSGSKESKEGLNIFNMLEKGINGKPKGKIHIVWNEQDKVLQGSNFLPDDYIHMAGAVGPHWHDGWSMEKRDSTLTNPSIRDYVVGRKRNSEKGELVDSGSLGHRYFFEDWATDYVRENI